MKKLSRQASIVLFGVGIVLLLSLGIYLIRDMVFVNNKDSGNYATRVVVEDQDLVSVYLDTISTAKSDDSYIEKNIELKAGEQLLDYTLTKDQSFSKLIQMIGPNGKDILTSKSGQIISHYAYTMLLTGDIVEKTNLDTQEKTYEVINARITYNRIPLVLLSNSNSVCLRNKNKSKEKIVNLQEFIKALNDVNNRNAMISWS